MARQDKVRNTVRRHRLLQDIAQQELADRVNVTRQTIVSIDPGRHKPSIALALRLAEALTPDRLSRNTLQTLTFPMAF